MDGSIFLLIAVVGGVLLVTPVIAILALSRTRSFRILFDRQAVEYRDQIFALKREIADLRRALSVVTQQIRDENTQARSEPGARVAATAEPVVAHEPPASVVTSSAAVTRVELEEPVVVTSAAIESAVAPPAETPMPRVAPVVEEPVFRPAEPSAIPIAPPVAAPVAARVEEAPQFSAEPLLSGASPAASRPQIPTEPLPPVAPPSFSYRTRLGEDFRNQWAEEQPRRKSVGERLRATLPLEEVLGMNLFAKIGIVLLVLGFALLGRVALVAMGPGGKVALLYAAAAALLGGGIWLEGKERYRLIGRTGIGGGWALLFFTTYAMWHVPAMRVMDSLTLNCSLLLVVAIAMVAHTLRYQSQVVTGLAFLLAFSTVALSQDTVYALSAGVILTTGIVVICLRMRWYELEIFGILATFGNHFYWLYKLYPGGVAGHAFPQFWPSCIILVSYWLAFRISYVVRDIRTPRDERLSTVAALLNTMLLLAVMKFQSTRPELAFYALLALGALEFLFGQLPATRRRRAAFIVLTVVGSMLMLAAVPFKFSGNNIALLWMIGAESLLIAGIAQAEVVFRRIALITGLATGLLVTWKAIPIVELRQHSEAPLAHNGILLVACSVLFYANAHFLARRWKGMFEGIDERIAILHSYIGGITAFLGSWAIFTGDWTALAWAALLLGAGWNARKLANNHLLAQGWIFSGAVILRAVMVNFHVNSVYPQHIATRLITLPILALLSYATAASLGSDEWRAQLRTMTLWMGSGLLAALAWLEVDPVWVAPLWMALAMTLVAVRRRIRLNEFSYQEHVLALMVVAQLVFVNLQAASAVACYVPILLCAAAFYGVSRFCTQRDAGYYWLAAYAHTWIATGLLAALAWHEAPQPWLAPCWILFALALALVDRIFGVQELPYQAHVLSALAVLRTVALNLFLIDKWHGVDTRLLTVCVVVAALYANARWARMPQGWRDRDFHHAYTWAGSILAAWMLWSELQPVAVAVGVAILGLLLFEWGTIQRQLQLRLQGYAALVAAFGRIFFVNLTALRLPGEAVSPAVFTVVPVAAICFYVWARLGSGETETTRWPIRGLIAWLGTVSAVALLYFQVPAEWVVAAWASAAVALLVASLFLRQEVFLHQAAAMVVGVMVRGIAHNIYGGSYFTGQGWRGNFGVVALTALLLLAGLPIAFRLRARYAAEPGRATWNRRLGLDHPEQWFFFAPVVLLAFLIAVKMNPGMVTLSWGIEGVLVILLGLATSQRSYRLSGLLLLLLCVGKIVFLDAWHLQERDRYITFIVLGGALILVSTLYNRYRETVRRLL